MSRWSICDKGLKAMFSCIAYVKRNHIITGRSDVLLPNFLDCIEVFKVYDHCVTSITLQGFETISNDCVETGNSVVACTVLPETAVCRFAGFGAFTTPFFRPVNVLSSVQAAVAVTSRSGSIIGEPFQTTIQGLVSPVLWAPENTFAQCAFLKLGDCSCTMVANRDTGLQAIACILQACLEIQIIARVKMLVPSYGFCKPPAGPKRGAFRRLAGTGPDSR
jgi:hypothetical protein